MRTLPTYTAEQKKPLQYKLFLSHIQKATVQAPRWLVTDNAGEYMSDIVSGTLADLNIEHISAIPYKSEENGIAERFNRTAMNAVRAALDALIYIGSTGSGH